MARPRKQTVDYFPHDTDASDGKTLTILQNKYGNDGFAFWFKLLQLLGKTPGHYYDYNNPANWEFLLAKTHINDTEKAESILDTLSKLDAIDQECFEHKIIWCQKFVDGISDAYKRTKGGVPKRPPIKVNANNNRVNVNKNSENPTLNTQTKLNKTKLDNIYILPEFSNIKLSKEEHEKLIKLFGEAGTRDRVENLSLYIGSTGKKYASHYLTILAWDKRDKKEAEVKRDGKDNSYLNATTPDKFFKGKYGDAVVRSQEDIDRIKKLRKGEE